MVRISIILCILSIALYGSAFSQQAVSGVIVNDHNHAPIPYVSVAIVGKPYGTVSNQNGAFSINLTDAKGSDSIGFFCIGYETLSIAATNASENMIIRLREKVIKLDEVTVTARQISGKALVRLALENKARNYPSNLLKRTVFKRNNAATYLDRFDLRLNKSTLPAIDEAFVNAIEDSIIRYSRSFSDYLYHLYNSPDDSVYTLGKIDGIKRIELNEEIGGEMEQIEKQFNELFDTHENGIFWKLKTGPISAKLNDPEESALTDSSSRLTKKQLAEHFDSIYTLGSRSLYNFDRSPWALEFLLKPERYTWHTQGIMPVRGERCYVVHFKGHPGKDYTGRMYISEDSYAILRIEYELKARKADRGVKLLGINYNESDDSGIVIFDRDENGYYLKYQMHSTAQLFAINRPFLLIQKLDRPIFNKRVHTIDFSIHVVGRDERIAETLVISRENLSEQNFNTIEPRWINTDKITSYSDDLWKGYSILEPTRQMKEYTVKLR